jgi:hypothetical protein
MSRTHIFAIVLLLGAAAVAGLLALTRATTAATQAPNAQIAAKSRSLDQLEASLRRSLARPPTLPIARSTAVSRAPRTVFVPSSGSAQAAEDQEDDDGDDDAFEENDEHERDEADD